MFTNLLNFRMAGHSCFSVLVFLSVLFAGCSANKDDKLVFLEKIGVCTSIDHHELLHNNAYDYVEENLQRFLIPFEPHAAFLENLNGLEDANVPVLAVNVFVPAQLKSVGPEAAHPEIIAFADTAFRRASMAGIETIVFGSGGSRRIPDGFAYEEATAQFVALLKQMGPLAERYGVYVAIEPLNRGEVNFINSVAEGLEIVKLADHPNIRLLCDFYHMLKEDEPASHIIQASGYIQHVHVAEKADRTPPGIAGDDFRPYLTALKEAGYTGHISIEARWNDFEAELPVAIEALRKQIEDVRNQ